MTKLKDDKIADRTDSLVAEESAINSLLFWINATTSLHGANFTINYLLNGIKEMIEQVATIERIDHVEEMLTKSITESCDIVRRSVTEPEDLEEKMEVINKKLDKLFH